VTAKKFESRLSYQANKYISNRVSSIVLPMQSCEPYYQDCGGGYPTPWECDQPISNPYDCDECYRVGGCCVRKISPTISQRRCG
jgi:hypothetical protein